MVAISKCSLRLNFDVDARGQIQLHERVEGLLRRLEDIEQALVGADLELLARLLVDVRSTKDRVTRDMRGERDGARDAGARALGRLDDVVGRLVEKLVIERLEANADLRGGSHGLSSRITRAPS